MERVIGRAGAGVVYQTARVSSKPPIAWMSRSALAGEPDRLAFDRDPRLHVVEDVGLMQQAERQGACPAPTSACPHERATAVLDIEQAQHRERRGASRNTGRRPLLTLGQRPVEEPSSSPASGVAEGKDPGRPVWSSSLMGRRMFGMSGSLIVFWTVRGRPP